MSDDENGGNGGNDDNDKDIIKLPKKDVFSFQGTMVENMKMAEMLAESSFVPDNYKKKPGDILAAVQMGLEVGLTPVNSLLGIAVINGRPCLYGDALIGLVRQSSLCEYIKEEFDHDTWTATCIAKRVGEPPQSRSFSIDDAQTAGLWDTRNEVYSFKAKKNIRNQSAWRNYPKRMLKHRARGFCLRDLFPDVLKGLSNAEEMQDLQNLKQIN